MKLITDFIILIWWLAGIYVANGPTLKIIAVIFPPYAMYEVVAAVIAKYNLL